MIGADRITILGRTAVAVSVVIGQLVAGVVFSQIQNAAHRILVRDAGYEGVIQPIFEHTYWIAADVVALALMALGCWGPTQVVRRLWSAARGVSPVAVMVSVWLGYSLLQYVTDTYHVRNWIWSLIRTHEWSPSWTGWTPRIFYGLALVAAFVGTYWRPMRNSNPAGEVVGRRGRPTRG